MCRAAVKVRVKFFLIKVKATLFVFLKLSLSLSSPAATPSIAEPEAPISLRSAIPSQWERVSVAFLSEKRGIAFLGRERHQI
jgi:hypothetical protein